MASKKKQKLDLVPHEVSQERFESYQIPEILGGKYDNKTGLQSALYWDPRDDKFHIQFDPGKASIKNAKKKLKETIRESKYFEKYRDVLKEKEIRPLTVLHPFGEDQKAVQEVKNYFEELMATPAKDFRKELMRQPRNWKRAMAYTITLPFAVAGGFMLANFLGAGQAIGDVFNQITKPLQDARDYLDVATQGLIGLEQSAISLGSILQPLYNVAADGLARVTNGMTYYWNDGITTTPIVPDFDMDGQVDIWYDGGWQYDLDSGNPAIAIHQAVQSGSTLPPYLNISKIFEEYGANFEAYTDLKTGLQNAISVTNGLSPSIQMVGTQVANADAKIADALGYIPVSAAASPAPSAATTANVGTNIKSWAAQNPKAVAVVKELGKAAILIPLSIVVPAVGLGYWAYRIGKIATKDRKAYNEFQTEYKPVLELEGPMTVAQVENHENLNGAPLPIYKEVLTKYRDVLSEADAAA